MTSSICQARIHFGKAAVYSGKPSCQTKSGIPLERSSADLLTDANNIGQGGVWNKADAEYAKATVGYGAWERFSTVVRIFDPMAKFSDHDNILIEEPLN